MTPPDPFPGFSEPKENYFRLPNDWFAIAGIIRQKHGDRLAAPLKLLEYVLCHTWGYQRFDGQVRLTAREIHSGRKLHGKRMDLGTGLSENSVTDSGQLLHELGLLEIVYDETDQARRVRSFCPRLKKSEAVDAIESKPIFDGFDPPRENYFKVPRAWTNLTRKTNSGATLLATEYCFRHAWGYHNPDGIWMDVDDVANGRKYVTSKKRYDSGIGFGISTTYRALNEGVECGFLVWAIRWAESGASHQRVYNLRLKGMPVDAAGMYLGRLPWEPDFPVQNGPESNGTVEDIVRTNEVACRTPDGQSRRTDEDGIRTIEDIVPAIEESLPTDDLMLRSLENLEFIKSHANSLEIQMCPQGEMIEMALDLQAFQLEESVKSSKNMVVLSNHSTNRCFAQSSILFERLVEDFYRPSFLIGR